MKILKDIGSFDILTPISHLREQLLIIERAGRTCYQSEEKEITLETAKKFIRMILKRGHESVIEHSNMTVQFNNVSRGFTHEQVRHRLTAISQESTRYVDYAQKGQGPDLDLFQLRCVVPSHRDENEIFLLEDGSQLSVVDMFHEIEKFYRALRRTGWPPEDARQLLPIGIRSQIVISANFREWRHIFEMRTSRFAHWEIRKVMCDLLEHVKLRSILSPIFDDFNEMGRDKNSLRYFEKRRP